MDYGQLESRWEAIQAQLPHIPFFLTWPWVSCWLHSYHPRVIVVTAFYRNQPVCIGLMTNSIHIRHGLFFSRQLRLHQTGIASKDQIWIEYNDFLSLDEHRFAAVNACVKKLLTFNDWDEFIISMMPEKRAQEICRITPMAYIDQVFPCYEIDLKSLSRSSTPYLDSLSTNTRYQINKSRKLYEKKYGALDIRPAASINQALEYFREAGVMHKSRWSDSGFNNIHFTQFHENLIHRAFQSGQCNLLKIIAGETTVGILYFLIFRSKVSFYLQGVNYEPDRKLKPGLLSHALAIQFFLDMGITVYDFMGGHSQYKQQLAENTQNLVMLELQRPRSRFLIEKMLRRLKTSIITRLSNSPTP